MVLETLFDPKTAEEHNKRVFFLGLLYTFVAMALSLLVFREHSSLVAVFLIVIATIPLIYNTNTYEEHKDMESTSEKNLLQEHAKAIGFFLTLFLGIVVASLLTYIFSPPTIVQNLFSIQISTIQGINNNITNNATVQFGTLTTILLNNFKVLFLCLLFALLYGAGAVFILAWNATIIGAAIGSFIRDNLAQYTSSFGLAQASGYFNIISLGLFQYSLHGIPEILAYLIAGLAGGIISVALVQHHYSSPHFRRILIDVADLMIIAMLLVVSSGFIEVYITPILF